MATATGAISKSIPLQFNNDPAITPSETSSGVFPPGFNIATASPETLFILVYTGAIENQTGMLKERMSQLQAKNNRLAVMKDILSIVNSKKDGFVPSETDYTYTDPDTGNPVKTNIAGALLTFGVVLPTPSGGVFSKDDIATLANNINNKFDSMSPQTQLDMVAVNQVNNYINQNTGSLSGFLATNNEVKRAIISKF